MRQHHFLPPLRAFRSQTSTRRSTDWPWNLFRRNCLNFWRAALTAAPFLSWHASGASRDWHFRADRAAPFPLFPDSDGLPEAALRPVMTPEMQHDALTRFGFVFLSQQRAFFPFPCIPGRT